MKTRLVAYRKATTSSTSDTTYQLDLQEAPNISLNFQFSDIKDPASRKGSFSQTFKLPFTDNNNAFFENWYNVNLETLVFSTRKQFQAVLYIGTTPQFEGLLQLKSIYQKARYYEVVLMSNTATLFSVIGESRLKDVFLNEDGSYSNELNHIYNESALTNSWNGQSGSFQNTSGVSLQDTSVDVNKVMYPISITREKFYYNGSQSRYLNLDQTSINNMGYTDASQYTTILTQFRPAIQLKTMIQLIIAKAGFSYTSNFIDGSYFGKLFMTTGGHLESSAVPTTNANASPSGVMYVATQDNWGEFTFNNDNCIDWLSAYMPLNLEYAITDEGIPADPDNIWDSTDFYFTKSDYTMESIKLFTSIYWSNMEVCNGYSSMAFAYRLEAYDPTTGLPITNDDGEIIYYGANFINTDLPDDFNTSSLPIELVLSLETMPIGAHARIECVAAGLQRANSATTATFRFGQYYGWTLVSSAQIYWSGYSINIYGATVDVPACIDPDLKQGEFIKDIVQRFNLVIVTDPENDTNLIIEPYNDFIASGEMKHWTDKLDASKEIIIKDTTDLQKKVINFSDKEDNDIYNKEIKDYNPDLNVFGHIRIEDWNNDYAKGELKNDSIFSPYINGKVYKYANTTGGTQINNMAVQYEFSVEQSSNETTNPLKKTKSKLFFYNGMPTPTQDQSGNAINYYLHSPNPLTEVITAYPFNTYPLCTPFDIDTNTATYNLSADQKSLYWNSTPPLVGDLDCFSFSDPSGNWYNGSLFGFYWKDYLTGIYSTEARIMEAYVNISAYDIFQFKFNDEIFIKNAYWRILEIKNFQVGQNTSTKVTFIKSLDTKSNCNGCDYVLGTVNGAGDSNFVGDANSGVGVYVWCPEDDPGCTPNITTTQLGFYTQPECCDCNGGYVMWNQTAFATQGLYPCLTYAGSPPTLLTNQQGIKSIFNQAQVKGLLAGKLAGEIPFVIGSANNKYNTPILPDMTDDNIIKYEIQSKTISHLDGESHRMILLGKTVGTTRGYAYAKGSQFEDLLKVPSDVNLVLRVKGITSVISSQNSSYPLGTTEAIAYYTAFKVMNGASEQLGVAGGTIEFSLKEGSTPTSTCTLYIDISSGVLRFGLDDSQTHVIRLWELSVDLDINRIPNLAHSSYENWALFQDGQNILLQDYEYLIWN